MNKITTEMVEYFVEDKYKNAIKVILEIANSYKDNRPWSPDILISDIRQTWNNRKNKELNNG
jgi:hypothetical protein|tara:strand:+ start:338 stop:523 length:186 start_codon:yes stop_codon:yes gene_type:complete